MEWTINTPLLLQMFGSYYYPNDNNKTHDKTNNESIINTLQMQHDYLQEY